ncbi:hypothetical protein [Nonomuraea maritima]|uniref:hypothetical protein n=1 Tax=Nonomuraea maritima TaxID=683260 RepID=UPI0037179535
MTTVLWTMLAVGLVVTVVRVYRLASWRLPVKWVERGGWEAARQKMARMSAAAVVLMLMPIPFLREWEMALPVLLLLALVSSGIGVWDLVVWENRYPKRRQAPLPSDAQPPHLPGEVPPGRPPGL